MQWLILAAIAALAALAVGYYLGAKRCQRSCANAVGAAGASEPDSQVVALFDGREAEESFMCALPEAVALVGREGGVLYEREDIASFGLTSAARLRNEDVSGMLSQVAGDGRSREREIQLPFETMQPNSAHSGRGLRAGDSAPSSAKYLRVRVNKIDEERYAVFVSDVSEQRRFADMRRDFVTNVSHELKTPAGAISLLAETLSDAADDPDAVRYFSNRVAKEAERLGELVQRLIELQRAQEGISNPKRLSVVQVVRAAIEANRVQAEGRHIELVPSFEGEPVVDEPTGGEQDAAIYCDESAITTAVKNLIENAIHYSPERTTVRVAISQQTQPTTTVRQTQPNQQTQPTRTVAIRVIDQGIGIPVTSIDRIFERFYRVDPARSRQTGGTGLGLSITKHCVEECGGTVTVWSREREGSTFTIELPEAGKADEASEAGIQEEEERQS